MTFKRNLFPLLVFLVAAGAGLSMPASSAEVIKNSSCLDCHADKTLTKTNAAGKEIKLFVDEAKRTLRHKREHRFDFGVLLFYGCYIQSTATFLNPAELANLAFAGKLLTLECGLRFLADYLQGDIYFKIKRPSHNLDRCRNQFAYVAAQERKMGAMETIVARA